MMDAGEADFACFRRKDDISAAAPKPGFPYQSACRSLRVSSIIEP